MGVGVKGEGLQYDSRENQGDKDTIMKGGENEVSNIPYYYFINTGRPLLGIV